MWVPYKVCGQIMPSPQPREALGVARRCRTCFSSKGFWIFTTSTPTGTEESAGRQREQVTQPGAFSVPQMQKLRLAIWARVLVWEAEEGATREGRAGLGGAAPPTEEAPLKLTLPQGRI